MRSHAPARALAARLMTLALAAAAALALGCELEDTAAGDESCGYTGPFCQQVVDCCSDVRTNEGSDSPAAGQCTLFESEANQHLSTGDGNNAACRSFHDDDELQASCFSCPAT